MSTNFQVELDGTHLLDSLVSEYAKMVYIRQVEENSTNTTPAKDNAAGTNLESNTGQQQVEKSPGNDTNGTSYLDENINELKDIVNSSKISDDDKSTLLKIIEYVESDAKGTLITDNVEPLKLEKGGQEIKDVIAGLNKDILSHYVNNENKEDLIQLVIVDKGTRKQTFKVIYIPNNEVTKALMHWSIPFSENFTQQSENFNQTPEILNQMKANQLSQYKEFEVVVNGDMYKIELLATEFNALQEHVFANTFKLLLHSSDNGYLFEDGDETVGLRKQSYLYDTQTKSPKIITSDLINSDIVDKLNIRVLNKTTNKLNAVVKNRLINKLVETIKEEFENRYKINPDYVYDESDELTTESDTESNSSGRDIANHEARDKGTISTLALTDNSIKNMIKSLPKIKIVKSEDVTDYSMEIDNSDIYFNIENDLTSLDTEQLVEFDSLYNMLMRQMIDSNVANVEDFINRIKSVVSQELVKALNGEVTTPLLNLYPLVYPTYTWNDEGDKYQLPPMLEVVTVQKAKDHVKANLLNENSEAINYIFSIGLINEFAQTFTKNAAQMSIVSMTNSNVTTTNANSEESIKSFINEWSSNYGYTGEALPIQLKMPTPELKSASGRANYVRFQTVIPSFKDFLSKLQEIANISESERATDNQLFLAEQTLAHLGITSQDIRKVDEYFRTNGTVFTNSVPGIIGYLTQFAQESITVDNKTITKLEYLKQVNEDKFNVYDLNNNKGVKNKNVVDLFSNFIRLIADAEKSLNLSGRTNTVRNAENENVAGNQLFHQMSITDAKLNSVNKFTKVERIAKLKNVAPNLFSIYNRKSKIINSILNEDSVRVSTGYMLGLTSQNAKVTSAHFSESMKLIVDIQNVLGEEQLLTYFRAADRSNEMFISMKTASGSVKELISRKPLSGMNLEDSFNKNIYSAYSGYLEDELIAIMNYTLNRLVPVSQMSDNNPLRIVNLGSKDDLINTSTPFDATKLFNKTKGNGGNFRYFGELLNLMKIGNESVKEEMNNLMINFLKEQKVITEIDGKLVINKQLSEDEVKAITKIFVNEMDGTVVNNEKSKVKYTYLFNQDKMIEIFNKSFEDKALQTFQLLINNQNIKEINGIVTIENFMPIETFDNLYRLNIGERKTTGSPSKAEFIKLLSVYEKMSELGMIEQSKLHIGDPAQFKNTDDFFKRVKTFNSTKKLSFVTSQHNEVLNLNNNLLFKFNINSEEMIVKLPLTKESDERLVDTNDKDLTKYIINTGIAHLLIDYSYDLRDMIKDYNSKTGLFTDVKNQNLVESLLETINSQLNTQYKSFNEVLASYKDIEADANYRPDMLRIVNKNNIHESEYSRLSHGSTFTNIVLDDIVMPDLSLLGTIFESDYVQNNYQFAEDENGNLIMIAGNETLSIDDNRIGEVIRTWLKDTVNLFTENGVTDWDIVNGKLASQIEPFLNITEQDAEAYVTLPMYKHILISSGVHWTSDLQAIYTQAILGKDLTHADYQRLLRPNYESDFKGAFTKLKTQFTGPEFIDNKTRDLSYTETFPNNVYKHSLMPLIPSVIKNTSLEKLNNMMLKSGIHMLNYDSGNKFGQRLARKGNSLGKAKLYENVNGKGVTNITVNHNGNQSKLLLNGYELVVKEHPMEYLGIQVDMASKFKNEVTAGTQFRKLILTNMFNDGEFQSTNEMRQKVDFYTEVQNALYMNSYEDLCKEFGIDKIYDEKGEWSAINIVNRSKFIEILVKSMQDRESKNIILDTLQLTNTNAVIEMCNQSTKIQNVLFALLNSRVIREKRRGEGMPQASVTAWEQFGKRNIGTSNVLKTYRMGRDLNNRNQAKTIPAQVNVSLPIELNVIVDMIELTEQDKLEKRTKLDIFNSNIEVLHNKLYKIEETDEELTESDKLTKDEEKLLKLITLVGFRIPTQGPNSFDSFRVKKFLPSYVGTTIIVPANITGKGGSDFDIDKLTTYYPEFRLIKDEQGNVVDYSIDRLELDNKELLDKQLDKLYEVYISDKQLRIENKEKIKDLLSEFKADIKNVNAITKNNLKPLIERLSNLREQTSYAYLETLIDENKMMFRQLNSKELKDSLISIQAKYKGDNLSIDDKINRLNEFISIAFRYKPTVSRNDAEIVDAMIISYEQQLSILSGEVPEYIQELKSELNAKIKELKQFNNEDKKEYRIALEESIKELEQEYQKQIEENAIAKGLMSREQFKAQPFSKESIKVIAKLLNKDVLQNLMLAIQSDIILRPDNFGLLMTPNSDALFKDDNFGLVPDIRSLEMVAKLSTVEFDTMFNLADSKNKITKKDMIDLIEGKLTQLTVKVKNKTTNQYELSTLNRKEILALLKSNVGKSGSEWSKIFQVKRNLNAYIAFLVGKTCVGIDAVHNTSHILSQQVGLKMDKAVTLFYPHNTTKDGNISLGGIYTQDKQLISETISAYINAHVDVAKDPFIFDINGGLGTMSAILFMIRTGGSPTYVTRFMNQPIIKEYIKLLAAQEYPMIADSLQTSPSNQVLALLNEKYLKTKEAIKDFNDSIELIKGDNIPITKADGILWINRLGDKLSQQTVNNKLFAEVVSNSEHLAANIAQGLTVNSNPEFIKEQLLILQEFLRIDQIATGLTSMMRLCNYDTAGAFKTLSSNIEKEANSELASQLFLNWKDIQENTIVKVPKFAVNTYTDTLKNWSVLHKPIGDTTMYSMLNEYQSLMEKDLPNKSQDSKERFRQAFETSFITYLTQNTNSELNPKKVFNELINVYKLNNNVVVKDRLNLIETIQTLKSLIKATKNVTKKGEPDYNSFNSVLNQLGFKFNADEKESLKLLFDKLKQLDINTFLSSLKIISDSVDAMSEDLNVKNVEDIDKLKYQYYQSLFDNRTSITIDERKYGLPGITIDKAILKDESDMITTNLDQLGLFFNELYNSNNELKPLLDRLANAEGKKLNFSNLKDNIVKYAITQSGFNTSANSILKFVNSTIIQEYKDNAVSGFISFTSNLNEQDVEMLKEMVDDFIEVFKANYTHLYHTNFNPKNNKSNKIEGAKFVSTTLPNVIKDSIDKGNKKLKKNTITIRREQSNTLIPNIKRLRGIPNLLQDFKSDNPNIERLFDKIKLNTELNRVTNELFDEELAMSEQLNCF